MGFFDGITLDDFKALEPPAPPAPGLMRSAADTGLSLARGAVQGVKMLSDATGAGNPVSETLQRGIDWLSNNFSDYSQWEQLTSAQDQKAAALSGSTWEEIKAAARSFGKRPIDFLAEAAGTSIPTIAAAFLPGGQGAVLGRVAMLGMGGAQGAGSVKGQIFEEVEKAWKQAGSTPEEARERAAAAQDYFGSNSGQIALGTALGALAGSTGVEAGLVGRAAPKASIFERANVPRFVREGVKEAIPEAAQGGQETLAQNLALQNEGFDVPTMQGVAGNAVLEGLAGGAFGAAASPLHRQHAQAGARALATGGTVEEVIAGAMAVADSTPLAPAPVGITPGQEDRAMSAMERQARADDQALKFGTTPPPTPDLGARAAPGEASATTVETPPFSDRVLELRQQLADPAVRDALRALDERAFSTVAQYASVADRPDVNLPEATRERILSLAEGIVSRALLKPIKRTGVAGEPAPAGALPQPARAPAPQIGLDTSPTGTIRVDSRGNAAPETRADAIDTRQATAPRQRPDGMEQQVRGRPLPRDFQMVGEGTLTTPQRPQRETQLLTADGFPYGTRAAAVVRAKREGLDADAVEQVDGGFVVRTEPESVPAVPEQAEATVAAAPDDDYITKLFGTPEEQASAQARFMADADSKKRDLEGVRTLIAEQRQRAQKEHADWSGRVYKKNKTQVDLRGDGPSNQASMSIGAINESRRRNALDALSQELGAIDKLDKAMATDDGAARVMGNLRAVYEQAKKIAEAGNGLFKSADQQFEYMLLDELKVRGPSGRGNVTSNGLSKAALRLVNGEVPPKKQEAPAAAPPESAAPQRVGEPDGQGLQGQGRRRQEALTPTAPAQSGAAPAAFAVGDRFESGGKTWTVSAVEPKAIRATDGAGSSRTILVDSKTYTQAAQAREANAFPADKLARLSELTERTRADVGEQFTGFVRQYGRARADQMLDKALGEAEKEAVVRAERRAAEERARAEKQAAEKAERDRIEAEQEKARKAEQARAAAAEKAAQEERERLEAEERRARIVAEREEARRQSEERARQRAEQERQRAERERLAAEEEARQAEAERIEAERAEQERARARAAEEKRRRDELVSLRKREAVLNKLLACLG